jgi:protein-L-isoaspartate O-methyltransferase
VTREPLVTTTPARWRPSAAALAAALDRDGTGSSGHGAIARVPRHMFLPDRVWRRRPGGGYTEIDRARDPQAWWDVAYADEPVVTRFEDDGVGRRISASSASMPTLVAAMLDLLDVGPGDRVLEIGTGTGYNAALLCALVGDDRAVTSVEIDPPTAHAAAAALAAAGYAPQLVVADGTTSVPGSAAYDRVESTAAVSRVPYAWVARTRPGGRIVTPWTGGGTGAGYLVALDVDDHGTASGHLGARADFMLATGATPPPAADGPATPRRGRGTALDPRAFAEPALLTVLGITLPGVTLAVDQDDHDRDRVQAWGPGGAYACATHDPEDDHHVQAWGAYDLWARVEDTAAWWHDEGHPGTESFGLTVTEYDQYVWCDAPDAPRWPLA